MLKKDQPVKNNHLDLLHQAIGVQNNLSLQVSIIY